MKKEVLIEHLKELICGKQVVAALFYSFNFDVDFFENYLLPQFLPNIPFSDNAIQNAILWKKYQSLLPPVTVYCDFNAKGTIGPNLPYEVVTIDLPRLEGNRKPCFHPKYSFILLDDDTLILFNGSNNLTKAGWCANIECVNVFKLKPGVFYPQEFKNQLWNFVCQFKNEESEFTSVAERLIDNFFRKKGITESVDIHIYNSNIKDFNSFLKKEIKDKIEEEVLEIEVVSPYYSTGIDQFSSLETLFETNNITLSIPFENTDVVALDKKLFEEVAIKYNWGAISFDNSKGFRFNHSKIYRFYTATSMYTVAGSVNFTKAAFDGMRNGGNFETAILYRDDLSDQRLLNRIVDFNSFHFTQSNDEDEISDDRIDAFDLEFIIDWKENILTIINRKVESQAGIVLMKEGFKDVRLKDERREIKMYDEIQMYFAENTVIQVKPSGKKGLLFYYPKQLNLEYKPFSAKLKLNESDLISLWTELEGLDDKEQSIRIIERFCNKIQTEQGEDKEYVVQKSSINFMSAHLSALMKLKEKLFDVQLKRKELVKHTEKVNYYLSYDNIDTLVGYKNLLNSMIEKKEVNIGYAWVLYKVILKDFYNNPKLKDFKPFEDLETRKQMFENEVSRLEGGMLRQGMAQAKIKWMKENLLRETN